MHRLGPMLILLLPLGCAAIAGPFPTYPCFQAAAPPAMDGKLDGDPAWAGTVPATGFSKLGASYTVAKQTTFRACWDAEALYFGILCEEPDVTQMKFAVSDGGDAWLDDGIELFLQPDETTYQLIVTGRGSRSCGVGTPDFTKVQAAAGTGKTFYALEIRIPYSVVEARPRAGDRWRFNICRNTFTRLSGGDQFTSWAPLKRQFNEPENFAGMSFRGTAPGAAELAALERQVNDHCWQHLMGSIRRVVADGPEYAEVLDKAAKDETFGANARALRREWRRLQRLAFRSDDAPVSELRSASVSAAGLAQRSYDLKWKYLIHRLLEDN